MNISHKKSVIELAKEAGFGDSFAEVYEQRLERFSALVRAEREWVDLTDDEIAAICADLPFDENFDVTVARAVIAADREKNK